MINSFYIMYSPSLDQYIDRCGIPYTEIDEMLSNGISDLDNAKTLLSEFTEPRYKDVQIVRATIRVDIDEVRE